jgi:CRP/FNR family cyclic AMP-dependent transcriptional regulator
VRAAYPPGISCRSDVGSGTIDQTRVELPQETIIERLGALDWFSSLTDEKLEALASNADTVRWEEGDTIFEEGDVGRCCYVLHSGEVKVVRRLPDGRRITLAQMGPGSVFGELALFNGERRSASVVALDLTSAVVLAADDVMSVLRTDAEATLNVAIGLADRLRATNERLLEYALTTVSGRVVATLLAQVEARQAQGAGDRDVEVVGNATDIARLAGSSRESVARMMHWLENEGVISMKRGKTIVHDPSALSEHLL